MFPVEGTASEKLRGKKALGLGVWSRASYGGSSVGRNLRHGQGLNCTAQGKNTAIIFPVCERGGGQKIQQNRKCSLKVCKDHAKQRTNEVIRRCSPFESISKNRTSPP